eukprot:c15461_g1_i1.p1 GENE.c15461_g1_i1~~c15461_g1_i1.p1  ORF type:complete len:1046 (-),score=255.99 c15461_g1_i1:31-2880(-)
MTDPDTDDPFDLFISATNIRFAYYKDSHKILGNTYGMCVLQDFEALTPSLLARTIETVEGGGLVILLLRTMTSLKQLYSLAMDVHAHFRTAAHSDVRPRFNERFLLSLAQCRGSLVVDDELNVLPISSTANTMHQAPKHILDSDEPELTAEQVELRELKASLRETQPAGALVGKAGTLDQAKAILTFIEAISEKTLRNTVALTAARGRGKSAALGISIAAALAYGYSNIFVTAPSPENLKTLFEFVFKGLDALEWKEHTDYTLVKSTDQDLKDVVIRVNVFREHRQTIQYIKPHHAHLLSQAELVVIDEAAAIPLPLVSSLLGPYLVFMSSTINGYEGTGRSLSLKLLAQLRRQSATATKDQSSAEEGGSSGVRMLREIELEEPLRYATGDGVEAWLNNLLCLDATKSLPRLFGAPHPSKCELYSVNRDTLFSFHPASESMLQRMMALYVASHYKNSPNDLQLMSDAPAHQLFVLLAPQDANSTDVPDILCVIQVALEGELPENVVRSEMGRGTRSSGDLIPWTLSQQFQDQAFAGLAGARVVRIAVHPDVMHMGYGSRAMELLERFYLGELTDLREDEPMKDATPKESKKKKKSENSDESQLRSEILTPPSTAGVLLERLSHQTPTKLHWLGSSFGLTQDLFGFWNKRSFVPIYLRQTPNELTGEFTAIVLKPISAETGQVVVGNPEWLTEFHKDFLKRFRHLLAFQFRKFSPVLALSILNPKLDGSGVKAPLVSSEVNLSFSAYDLKRLAMYAKNMVDHHLITDAIPPIAHWYFAQRLPVSLSPTQAALLVAIGLQHKTIDEAAKEMSFPAKHLLALHNKAIRKFSSHFTSMFENSIGESLPDASRTSALTALPQTVEETLDEGADDERARLAIRQKQLEELGLEQYAIPDDQAWEESLPADGRIVSSISVKAAKRATEKKQPTDNKRKGNGKDGGPKKKSKFKNFN